jgi:hypothetical protein
MEAILVSVLVSNEDEVVGDVWRVGVEIMCVEGRGGMFKTHPRCGELLCNALLIGWKWHTICRR